LVGVRAENVASGRIPIGNAKREVGASIAKVFRR
jgi:hypothetical protein